jgi:hypothetical protein
MTSRPLNAVATLATNPGSVMKPTIPLVPIAWNSRSPTAIAIRYD